MDINKPDTPYIILESDLRSRNSRVGVYIIGMTPDSSLRIGRGHDSDIRIPDISVSRFHASIHFSNGNFYLEDNISKFGTLIAAPDCMIVN